MSHVLHRIYLLLLVLYSNYSYCYDEMYSNMFCKFKWIFDGFVHSLYLKIPTTPKSTS